MASNITIEIHEFRLSSGSDFYTSVVLGTKANIDTNTVYELVQDRLSHRTKQAADALPKNINEKNKNIYRKPRLCKINNITVNENEIKTLSILIKTRLCIIYVTKYNKITSSIRVHYYGNYNEESIYMVYDETQHQYCSLYLYNTTDLSKEKITILPSYNKTINTLLRKYFMSKFNYHDDVQLDDELQTITNDVLDQGQLECDNITRIIDMETEVNALTEQRITDNDEYPTMSVTTAKIVNQISSNVTTNISEIAPTLRRKQVPGDGSCLYSSFLYAMSLTLTVQDLRNRVADYILQMDIDDSKLQFGAYCQNRKQYCDGIRKTAWAGEPELVALSQMYYIMITVINLRKNQQQNLPINPLNYGENDKLCINCIYIIFDEGSLHYEPLYLCGIKSLQGEITNFNRDDTVVNDLLPDFIKSQIDSNDPSKVMTCTNHMLDESVQMLDLTVSKTNSFNGNEQYTSANNIISTIQNAIPYKIYEFRIGELPGDDQSLYASVIFQFDRSKMINVKCLRKNVADVIRSHNGTNGIHVSSSLGYQNREDYERNGLSYLYPDILFCIISKPNKNNNTPCIDTYVKDISSYKKCIFILYNEENNSYMPLYLHNKINDEEEKTSFKYDDTVKDLLREFIQNKLDYSGYVNFDSGKHGHAMDLQPHVEHESLDLAEMITENSSKNKSKKQNMKKRKAQGDDDNLKVSDRTKKSTSNTNNENTRSLTSSRPIPPNDQVSTFHGENDTSDNIETLLQTDMFVSCDPTITNMMEEQQQIEDLSPTLSTNTSIAACSEQMRLEIDPIKIFRGRAKTDCTPTTETKRDGTKAQPRKPSYFPDCNNEHYLNLLIPTIYLFDDPSRVWVEITLVTRTINGCIYLNPLFDFYPYNKNGSYGNPCNPMYIKLEDDKTYPMTKYKDEIQKLVLKLVVIMLKNDELLKKQPMKVFKLASSSGQRNNTVYRTHDTFKNAFHLNNVRFAITLWTQGPNDKEHKRRPDIQYISPVSTQVKTFKVTMMNNG